MNAYAELYLTNSVKQLKAQAGINHFTKCRTLESEGVWSYFRFLVLYEGLGASSYFIPLVVLLFVLFMVFVSFTYISSIGADSVAVKSGVS